MKNSINVLCLFLLLVSSSISFVSCKKHTQKNESINLHFRDLETELESEKDILFDYDAPPKESDETSIREGRWKDGYLPIERQSDCDPHFVEKLDSVINSHYVQQQVVKCYDKCFFGVKEHDKSCYLYIITTDEFKISWFKSYRHYLTDHHICPTRAFYRIITNLYNRL